MRKRVSFIVTAAVAVTIGVIVDSRLTTVEGQGNAQGQSFAAIPAQKGGQDIFGGYDKVMDWPKPLASLPGNAGWTWGAGQGVFAETPNRVFILQSGELPAIERPKNTKIAPSVEFPIGRLPWRDATSASPPGALFAKDGKSPGDDLDAGEPGVDY